MPHDVFISYSSHDKAVADATCAALEAEKIRCWIAPRDVLAGTEYGESIVRAIEDCCAMVLIFSAHANESPHIRREVERAVSKGKIILPFRIENVLPSRSMEYCLSNTHWLDALTPPIEKRITELVANVGRLLQPTQKLTTPDSTIRYRAESETHGAESGQKLQATMEDRAPSPIPEKTLPEQNVEIPEMRRSSQSTKKPSRTLKNAWKTWRAWVSKLWRLPLEEYQKSKRRKQDLKAAIEWSNRPLEAGQVLIRCSGCGESYRLMESNMSNSPRCGKCHTALK